MQTKIEQLMSDTKEEIRGEYAKAAKKIAESGETGQDDTEGD